MVQYAARFAPILRLRESALELEDATRVSAGTLRRLTCDAALVRVRGIEPDGWGAAARWKREADIADRVLIRAIEAVAVAEAEEDEMDEMDEVER